MSDETHVIENLACSLPLVKLASLMRQVKTGTLFEFTTDNPCFEGDIRLWCQETGNILCNFRRENGRTSVIIMKS